jgi:monofunctional biosynthetic peptidoglycan transglycosylase
LRRLGRIALYGTCGFVLASIVLVVLYRAVPPPATPLMLLRLVDRQGIHKSWRSLELTRGPSGLLER